MGGVEKLILKLTSASTRVGVEARAELGKISKTGEFPLRTPYPSEVGQRVIFL